MQRYTVYFIWKLLYMLRVVPSPIIRSTNNNIYSIWYLSHSYGYITDCNDIRPQTAQFYNERISTDLNLVTLHSTVYEPPENGLKNGTETCRGKFLGVFNVNFSAF